MRTVLPLMQAQGYGRIVNVSSGAAVNPVAGWSAYCAAKAGLDMLTKTAALELRGTPITVNALHPGMVNTDMQEDIRSVDTDGSRLDFARFHAAHAEGELRTPDAVARMIYWLAGPWSRGLSGEIFTAADAEWLATVDRDIPGQ
jgi:NAD(P)-dependent dehydrogenase (short-subunit alcohol dehydrogenase family)